MCRLSSVCCHVPAIKQHVYDSENYRQYLSFLIVIDVNFARLPCSIEFIYFSYLECVFPSPRLFQCFSVGTDIHCTLFEKTNAFL